MSQKKKNRAQILIADDSEMNRSILADMLGDEYGIFEAEDGMEAVTVLQQHATEIDLVLLDIVMPKMNGFEVLTVMNQRHWIDDIPVIMISAENSPSHVERAFELGVTDFISRPFDTLIVHRRVVNTVLLYAKQKKLVGLVMNQIYEKEKRSSLMIDILSHIVEFRNGESGLHVLHVRTLTELMLRYLTQMDCHWSFTRQEISLIATASALHDIGKISIPEQILNKPGKLTQEEFETMKQHTVIGAKMLQALPIHQDEPLLLKAYEICRWHHERYDGRGYPDGLKGDQIPIAAQVVALADVYDALTSERVYKPPFTHDQAVRMILNGECGVFNPLLMECLTGIADNIRTELGETSLERADMNEIRGLTLEMLQHEELAASDRTLQLLEHERMKYNFFAALTQEIQFEYSMNPPLVNISAYGAEKLGLPELITDPVHDERVQATFPPRSMRELSDLLRTTSPDQPVVHYDTQLRLDGEFRWYRFTARATWTSDEPPRYMGAIGKAVDIHTSRTQMDNLERMASHDSLTGLLNHASAKKHIKERIESRPGGKFALIFFDLDDFKAANDTYGHQFGDRVLIFLADRLQESIRGGDIAARVGGDEFITFIEYKDMVEPVIQRIFNNLCGNFHGFDISISMGIAQTDVVGLDYDALFRAADQAAYCGKRSGKQKYSFYTHDMAGMQPTVTPIDGDTKSQQPTTDDKGAETT